MPRPQRPLQRLVRAAAVENAVVVLVGVAATLLLLGIGLLVTPDTWLALLAGRAVAHGGPPSADHLTAWTLGREWVDQQWLGQLALYGIWRTGGLALVGLVHVAVVVATFVATLAAARRRSGSPNHVALVGLLALLPIGLVAGNIRAQTFALALFVAVLWLVSQDSRAPSRRVFWTLALLALWANVHGSVIVGCGLVGLGGAIALLGGLRARQRGPILHGVAMIGLVPIALLATPYGFSLLAYFGDVFGNPEIAKIASDWMPTTLEPVHVPFFVLAGLALVMLGRERERLTTFEQLSLVVLLVGALAAERNLAWFALAAVLLVAPLLTAPHGAGDRRSPPPALAAAVSALAIAVAALAGVVGMRRVDDQIQTRYPAGAAAVVARAADSDPSLRLLTHPRYADWLAFEHPSLVGRIPFDIRFELLTAAELRRFRRFRDQIGVDWRSAVGGARLLVLDSSEKPLDALAPTSAVLLREAGARLLYDDHDVAVILRSGR